MPRLTGDIDRMLLGARVRQLRQELDLTLEQLADRTDGRAPTWIGQVERGQGNPRFVHICSLAHGLGVEVTDLFTGWSELAEQMPRLAAEQRRRYEQ